ncbi:MAG: CPBP family intramembrane glutamic endopeptidase [Acidobacteriota bacterium]
MKSDEHPLAEGTNTLLDRSLAFWEIASVVTSCVIAEWVVSAVAGGSSFLITVPVLFAFAFMLWSHRLRGESARDVGFRLDNFVAAARVLALPMILGSALLVIVGYTIGSLNFLKWRGGQSVLGMPALGILWGLVQQYALQGFINRRAQIIWGKGVRSILFVALLFAAFHLPNPGLMVATFVGGVIWAAVYQRAPNLLALALSHGILTWVLISSVPASLLNGLRVGYKYIG